MSVAAQFEANASEDLSSPFYFNPSHWRAMDGVVEGVKAREGIMVMTGPTGSGKTMLMRAISDNLGAGVTPLFLQYASLNFREFVNFLHNSLNVGDEVLDASNKAVALRKFLYAQAERKETAVVFIDEAQNVEPDVLRMLPKLACFDQLEDGTNVGLQFMLTGGSELREILEDADFEQVQDSIARNYELRFFTREELKYFLEKRLSPLARLTPEPITDGAIETVGKYTGGSPRLMGMICSHAMLFAAENPGRSIDESMIEEAAEALMIEPVENPFAHEEKDTGEVSGPYSSAEIRGDAPESDVNEPDQFSLEAASQEADMTGFDSPIGHSVDDSYDDDSFIDEQSLAGDDFESLPNASIMDEMGMGMDVERLSDEIDEDEFEYDDTTSSKALAGAAGAVGVAGLAGGSVMGRVKSVFSRGKKIGVADKIGDVADTGADAIGGAVGSASAVGGSAMGGIKSVFARGKKLDVADKMGDVVDAGRKGGGDLLDAGTDALGDTASTVGAVGGSAMGGIKSVFARGKKLDLSAKAGDMLDDGFEAGDEFVSAGTNAVSSKVSSVGASGGSMMKRAKSALSRKKSGEKAQIVGAGRKGQNAQRAAAPVEKRAMKTRVAGQRKKQLKYAGYAAGFCALAFGAYMVRTDVSKVVASATDSVSSTASSAFDKVASAGSDATDMFTGGLNSPTTGDASGNGDSMTVASLDTGSVLDTPMMPVQPVPAVPQAAAPVKQSGWGAKVEVIKPTFAMPELSMPDVPKLPETGINLTRGALDLVDSVLDKGKEVLPDDVKAALDVASADVQELRTAATVNGATDEERAAKVSKLVTEADAYYARQLYIAPRGGNAYDAYRAALDIDPDNAAAARGIENLRSFYSKKAEAARAQKQWDRANRHFGTALAISQRKGVR